MKLIILQHLPTNTITLCSPVPQGISSGEDILTAMWLLSRSISKPLYSGVRVHEHYVIRRQNLSLTGLQFIHVSYAVYCLRTLPQHSQKHRGGITYSRFAGQEARLRC